MKLKYCINCGKKIGKRSTRCYSCAKKGKIFTKEHREKLKKNHADVSGKNNPMYGRKFSKEHRQKISIANKGKNKGENHPRWQGGIMHDSQRVLVLCPNHPNTSKSGYIYRYRLVMEKKLGRYLKPEEVVHHINGITDDDRPENLELFKNDSLHTKFHHVINRKSKKIKEHYNEKPKKPLRK